ncbi:hypothetical protein CWE27_28135 [Streptomyces sp. EAG2]|nr:hypothetical protein CWE27_28135 [Streptomyces sp. EAG2]
MCAAGLIAAFLPVDAEGRGLEDIAAPLPKTEPGNGGTPPDRQRRSAVDPRGARPIAPAFRAGARLDTRIVEASMRARRVRVRRHPRAPLPLTHGLDQRCESAAEHRGCSGPARLLRHAPRTRHSLAKVPMPCRALADFC